MSATLLDELLENDKALLNAAIVDEEIAFRQRIIELKTITYKKKKRLEEKRRVKTNKKEHRLSCQRRISEIFEMSNNIVDDDHGPDEEVTRKIFDERCKLLRQKSETVDVEIKNKQETCDMLAYSLRNWCKVLFQLNRLEKCCKETDLWVEGLKETAAVNNSPLFQEELIAEHIRGLLCRRDQELGRIEVLTNKINAATESLKNATSKSNNDLSGNGNNDRSFGATENDNECGANHLITNATKMAKERLTLLRQENNDLYSKIKATKTAIKRDTVRLEMERAKEERAVNTNTRAVAELNKNNAAITSNIEYLMQQLNFEHYGLGGGPSSQQATQQKQLAISERRAALSEQRAKSKEGTISPPKYEAGSSVHDAEYCANDQVNSPNPENTLLLNE